MKIKIGDKIRANHNREGFISDINIGLTTTDIAGELGVSVKEYDTELNYYGSVSYVTDSNDCYWSYFHQIEGVIKNA